MGSCLSTYCCCCCCCSCCSYNEEEQPFANIDDLPVTEQPPACEVNSGQPVPDHAWKNRRVRVITPDKYRGGLVKEVFARVQAELCEAKVLLDDVLDTEHFPLTKLEVLENVKLGDFCVARMRPDQTFGRSGFVRLIYPENSVTRSRCFKLHMLDTDFNHEIISQNFDDYQLIRAPPPVTEEVSGAVAPISIPQLQHFQGRNKGIQGKKNSCYLDTLLFSLFAFSDVVLDAIKGDEGADQSNLLTICTTIIYPLRRGQFVSKDHVELLRSLMAQKTGNESFKEETRDLPEAIEALFGKLLKWKPPLSISSIADSNYRFDSTFSLQLMAIENETPKAQSLLYAASCNQKFCIEKTPSLFILQLPRQVEHHQVTFPDLEIDLGPTLFKSPKTCVQCGAAAKLQSFERFAVGGLPATFLCRSCAEELEVDIEAARELPEDKQEGNTRMFLSAVICIERSHFNCFVRCGRGDSTDRWVFFDSMSDQETLRDPPTMRNILFNIPLIDPVPHFVAWLSEVPDRWLAGDRSLDGFLESLEENERERASRLFKYAYMLIYSRFDDKA